MTNKPTNTPVLSAEEYDKILIMLAKHYQETKEIYVDSVLKICAANNPQRRDLTEFEQNQWQKFPLIQGIKLQNIVQAIAAGEYAQPLQERIKELEKSFENACNNFSELQIQYGHSQSKLNDLQSQLKAREDVISKLINGLSKLRGTHQWLWDNHDNGNISVVDMFNINANAQQEASDLLQEFNLKNKQF